MDSKEAYNVKFLSEPVIYQNSVYFTEKWIEGNEYKTSIFKFENEVVERITFGGKESYPMIIDGNLHYLKSEEKINHFVRIKGNTEPLILFSLAKIHKVVQHSGGLLIIGSEESNNDHWITFLSTERYSLYNFILKFKN